MASVDASGRLEGRMHGSTILTATFEGRSSTKSVQVVNNYGGRWEGRYVVRACRDTGELVDHDGGWCLAGYERAGSILGIGMTFVQGGPDLSDVTGTLSFYTGTLTGRVGANGRLTLGGSLTYFTYYDYPIIALGTLQVGPWDTTLDGTDGMTGRWSSLFTSLVGRRGTVHTENELLTMARASTSVRPPSAIR